MAKKKEFTDEELLAAVRTSNSMNQIQSKLGYLKQSGRSIPKIRDRMRSLGINEKTHPDLFRKKHDFVESPKSRSSVKKKFIQSLDPHEIKCFECHIGEWWNGKKLVLQLDHKNGINSDNDFENLRLLCPNCHSQTHTYARPHKVRANKEDKKESIILRNISLDDFEEIIETTVNLFKTSP